MVAIQFMIYVSGMGIRGSGRAPSSRVDPPPLPHDLRHLPAQRQGHRLVHGGHPLVDDGHVAVVARGGPRRKRDNFRGGKKIAGKNISDCE